MHNPFDRAVGEIADRIRPLLGRGHQLGQVRHELGRDRIVRIVRVDQCGHRRRHRHRIALRDTGDLSLRLGRDQPGLDQAGRIAKRFVDRRHS